MDPHGHHSLVCPSTEGDKKRRHWAVNHKLRTLLSKGGRILEVKYEPAIEALGFARKETNIGQAVHTPNC